MLVPGFTVDGQATDSIYSGDNGKSWDPSVGNFFHDDGSLETWGLPGLKEPAFGSVFQGTMRVRSRWIVLPSLACPPRFPSAAARS